MELFARGSEALAQVIGKGSSAPSRPGKALFLAHSTGIEGRLVFEVERDRAEYLSKSQSFKFSEDGLGDSPSLKHWTMESSDTRVPDR
jgi:hypothetical protein